MDPKDLTCYIGLGAIYLLSVNVLLGQLMAARYNPWTRWPHRRINLLKLHNWTAYVGLALGVMHPIPLLFVDKPRFGIGDILLPVSSPQQPFVNSLGAIALYLLAFTVVTSIYRGRDRPPALEGAPLPDVCAGHGVHRARNVDRSESQQLAARSAGCGEGWDHGMRRRDSRGHHCALSLDGQASKISRSTVTRWAR